MKKVAFKAICPLELGDTVAVKAPETAEEPREAYYLSNGHIATLSGTVEIHNITDIVTLHFLKTNDISFMYELDGSGRYEPLTVKIPMKRI